MMKKLILYLCGALIGFVFSIPFAVEGIIGILQQLLGVVLGLLIVYLLIKRSGDKLQL